MYNTQKSSTHQNGVFMGYVKLPKTKRGEKTMSKICEAAEELFAQNGFYGTEINDITKKAGVAAGTFYVYFPNKINVFLYLMDDLGRKLRRSIRLAKTEAPDASFIEKERITFRAWFAFVREHYGLFRIVWQSQFVDAEMFKSYYERFSKGYIDELSNSQQNGETRDLDPVLISYALMGIYSFVALKCLVFDGSEPDDETIDQLVEFISRGLSAF